MINYKILTPLLAFALIHSDGPYEIIIRWSGEILSDLVTKQELEDLTNNNEIINIDISKRVTNRRWKI